MSARTAALVALASPYMLLACQASPVATTHEQAIILSVTDPARLQDKEWLQRTAGQAGGTLRSRAAIAPDTAAFILACNRADNGCVQTLSRLRAQAGVRHAEPDQKVSIP